MTRLQLALDCDGLLSDFTSGALRVVYEVTGRQYAPRDVTEYDFAKALQLTAAERRDVMAVISCRRGFCEKLQPYPAALTGVQRLRAFGDIFVVTSPWDSNPWWRTERETWLQQHFGITAVHHAQNKAGFGADVFVDDRSDHVAAWAKSWPNESAVRWNTLHNTREPVPVGAHAIGSWDGLYELVERIAKETT